MKKKNKLPEGLYNATITGLSHEGRGIASVDGKTIFISNALPGETVSFRYHRVFSKYSEGEAVEISNPHKERVKPLCEHFDICGGCSLQHMSHEGQITHKQETLLQLLSHFGQVKPLEVLEPITGPQWGYRRKARLGAKYVLKKNKMLVGFREKDGRYLADINQCEILHPSVGKSISALKTFIETLSNREQIPQIEVAVSDEVTSLVIRHMEAFSEKDLESLVTFAKDHNFHIYLQSKGTDSITKFYPQDGNIKLHYDLKAQGLRLYFHNEDFTQINTDINEKMVERALELLEPQKDETILDLFCGLGNFTLPIAKYAKHVTGVEGSEEMVKRAKDNAAANHINNTNFFATDLSKDIAKEPWAKMTYNKLILDPPRCGADTLIANHLKSFQAERILYISCNPATLARDAGILVNQLGYTLTKAGIMDMFPHTNHVESIALFEKTSRRKS